MARAPTRSEINDIRDKGLARAQIRARLLARAAYEERERRGRIVVRWQGRRFARNLASFKAAYANATHPTQRIEAWLQIVRAEGQMTDRQTDRLEQLFHYRRGERRDVLDEDDALWARVPADVFEIRMMG